MGPGRGRLPSGPGPTVLPSSPPLRRPSIPAVGALVVTTVATAVVVGGARWLSNGADVVLIAIACIAYVVLISRRIESGLSIRLVSAAVALQTFVAVARPPGATQDLWYYAIYGRMLAVYHASPYTHVPADHPGDPFLTQIGRAWHHTPSVYGPVFTAVSGAASFVVGGSFLEHAPLLPVPRGGARWRSRACSSGDAPGPPTRSRSSR